jgi:hypothetical protein
MQLMKNRNIHRAFLLMMLISSLSGNSQIEIDGIFYHLNSDKKEAKVTFHNKPPYRKYRGNISIPSTVSHNDTLYTVTEIGYRAFCSCGLLESVTIPNTVKIIGEDAFYECDTLKTITIPEGVTTIGEHAFEICRDLTSVTFPNTLTNIGKRAFNCCEKLTSISIPEGVTSISKDAFAGCYNLASIYLPETLTSIDEGAFTGCEKLNLITLPQQLTKIGIFAFYGCNLKSIICKSITPPEISENTFDFSRDVNLRVPKGCKKAYEQSEYWKNFKISQM